MPRPDATGGETPALTRLGYGAANIGNLFRELTDDQAWAILDAAWESGIRYFDTAPHYGLGLSERRLGAFLRTKPRDGFVISTKAGRLLRANPDDDGGLDLAADFHVRTTLRRQWDFSEASTSPLSASGSTGSTSSTCTIPSATTSTSRCRRDSRLSSSSARRVSSTPSASAR
jgi:hypothetical protein